MKKLKVLHCVEAVYSGGVEQRRLSLARRLDKNKYDQALICTEAKGGLPKLFEEAGCSVHEIGVFRSILDIKRYENAFRYVREFKPDIIHGAVYEGVAVASVIGRLARVPIIIGEETSNPTNRSWKGNLFYRVLASLAHNLVAVSPAAKDYLINNAHIEPSKVTLINNGVEPSEFTSPVDASSRRRQLGFEPDDLILGSCGRVLDSCKRFSDLIKALPKILKQCERVRLLIIGDGPDMMALQELAGELGLSKHVVFVGYQSDPRPFYDIMDIFALASVREAFGLVLVEAMFANLPVVATRVGGIPDVVVDNETGYLVAPCDPDALADSILKLARSPEKRREMGANGMRCAMKKFSAARYVQDVDILYQRLAATRRV